MSAAAAADGGQKLARIARERALAAEGRFSTRLSKLKFGAYISVRFARHRCLARADISCYTLLMDDRHPDKKRARQDKRLDEALKETFPASDPVAVAPIDKPDPDAPPPKP